jgi:hypothetical protein
VKQLRDFGLEREFGLGMSHGTRRTEKKTSPEASRQLYKTPSRRAIRMKCPASPMVCSTLRGNGATDSKVLLRNYLTKVLSSL